MHTYTNTDHFKKQLISNILFFSAIILVIWIVFVFFSISYSEDEFQNEMQGKVTDTARKLDDVMSTLQSISLQASLFNWSESYQEENSEGIDYISLNRNISELVGLKALSPIVKNISLFVPQGKIVISDYGITTTDTFWKQTFDNELNLSSPYITNRNPSTYHLVDNLPSFSNTALFIKPISIEKKESIFIFLDTNRLLYELYSTAGIDNISLHIYDSKKNEIFTDFSHTRTYEQTQMIASEGDYLIFSSDCDSGLTVDFVVQKSMMQPYIVKNILIISLAMLILEILLIPLSYLLSTRNYKPVKEMIDAANVQDFQDVMDIIKESFSSSKITKEELSIYKPLLTTALFNQLRNPETNTAKVLSSLSSFGINLNHEYVRLVAFSNPEGQKKLEEFAFSFFTVDPEDNIFLVVGEEEELNGIEKIYEEDEENNIYITFSNVHSLQNCHKAFKEIDEATRYRNTEEDCYVFSFSEIENEIRSLDFSNLKPLELAIKSGKAKEARVLVENFFFIN